MLSIQTDRGNRFCDGLTRREMLRAGAIGLGGLTLPSLLKLQGATDASRNASEGSKAKSVILLYLNGGPSQLDMWDLKPDASEEIRGTFRPIDTRVPGVRICEHLPRLAAQTDKFTIIRSMNHTTRGHPPALFLMLVGTPSPRNLNQQEAMSREDRPHPGSALAKLLPSRTGMPPFVMIPEAVSPTGTERAGQYAGLLGADYDPYRVNSDPSLPDYSPGALNPGKDVSVARLQDRRGLLEQLGQQLKHLEQTASGQTQDAFQRRAFDLLSSPAAQRAFVVAAEPDKTRDRYGRHTFGQSVLVARRLVEAGVRLVHVNWVRHDDGKGGQGYDTHSNHLNWCKTELYPPTDAAISSLLQDLADRGLLEQTLVIVMGEFGRTPHFNEKGGRDHWPNCFSVVVAGGGIRGGQVYGASDKNGAYPSSQPVGPHDLTATLYSCLGVDPHTLIHDSQKRPHALVEGTPISGIL